MQEMETRYTHSPEDIRHYSTEQLRKEFLVEKVFEPGKISLTYTHNDRMIFGGVTPTEKELEITLDKELGVDYFLERRELGVINIGGPGFIEIDGQKEEMKNKTDTISEKKHDMLYFLLKMLKTQLNSILVLFQLIINIQMYAKAVNYKWVIRF